MKKWPANPRLVPPDNGSKWNLVRQTIDTEGSFGAGGDNYLEVVVGPWRF